ncbi:MAG: Uridine kinase, partial [uncultured Thermomicrobiales bacterium]
CQSRNLRGSARSWILPASSSPWSARTRCGWQSTGGRPPGRRPSRMRWWPRSSGWADRRSASRSTTFIDRGRSGEGGGNSHRGGGITSTATITPRSAPRSCRWGRAGIGATAARSSTHTTTCRSTSRCASRRLVPSSWWTASFSAVRSWTTSGIFVSSSRSTSATRCGAGRSAISRGAAGRSRRPRGRITPPTFRARITIWRLFDRPIARMWWWTTAIRPHRNSAFAPSKGREA